MIRIARRSAYFNKDPKTEVHWLEISKTITYNRIKFIEWVVEINGKIYERGSPEFKEEFNKERFWNVLKAEQ